jgi:hypothetical protein
MAMIDGKAKEDFKADIKLKGIQTKMMLFEGRLLDGRNRYTCGKELGFEFSEKDFDLFTGTYAEAEAYVISTNMMRRQMTNTQKAEVVERMIRKYPDDSNRKIAARCGMSSHSFVATVRERMENPPERREFEKFCKAFDNLKIASATSSPRSSRPIFGSCWPRKGRGFPVRRIRSINNLA